MTVFIKNEFETIYGTVYATVKDNIAVLSSKVLTHPKRPGYWQFGDYAERKENGWQWIDPVEVSQYDACYLCCVSMPDDDKKEMLDVIMAEWNKFAKTRGLL